MSVEKCLDYARKYISRYPKTEKEMYTQLLKKGFSQREIKETTAYLRSKKLLDDKNFVRIYIESEVMKKGKPISLIKKKLLHKGVEKKDIEAFIKKNKQQIDEGMKKKIKKDAEKYRKRGIDDLSLVQKLIEKGYEWGDIKKAV